MDVNLTDLQEPLRSSLFGSLESSFGHERLDTGIKNISNYLTIPYREIQPNWDSLVKLARNELSSDEFQDNVHWVYKNEVWNIPSRFAQYNEWKNASDRLFVYMGLPQNQIGKFSEKMLGNGIENNIRQGKHTPLMSKLLNAISRVKRTITQSWLELFQNFGTSKLFIKFVVCQRPIRNLDRVPTLTMFKYHLENGSQSHTSDWVVNIGIQGGAEGKLAEYSKQSLHSYCADLIKTSSLRFDGMELKTPEDVVVALINLLIPSLKIEGNGLTIELTISDGRYQLKVSDESDYVYVGNGFDNTKDVLVSFLQLSDYFKKNYSHDISWYARRDVSDNWDKVKKVPEELNKSSCIIA